MSEQKRLTLIENESMEAGQYSWLSDTEIVVSSMMLKVIKRIFGEPK